MKHEKICRRYTELVRRNEPVTALHDKGDVAEIGIIYPGCEGNSDMVRLPYAGSASRTVSPWRPEDYKVVVSVQPQRHDRRRSLSQIGIFD